MDMSTRCAVCGSKNVVKEFKKEGYDVKKGVVGTVLVGLPGALAGAGGKDVTYYHCADCGQVMNRTMYQAESNWIDKLLANPQDWLLSLREEKKRYKNIEWDESQSKLQETANEELSLADKHRAMIEKWDKIVIDKLKETQYIKCDELAKKPSQDDKSMVTCQRLENQGRIAREIINKEQYYRLVTDPNETREILIKQETCKYIEKRISDNIGMYKRAFYERIEYNKPYTLAEYFQILKEVFVDLYDDEKPYTIKEISSNFMYEMYEHKKAQDIIIKDGVYIFKDIGDILEIERKKEEEQRKREEAKARANEELKKVIREFLTRSEQYYAIAEMIQESEELSKYSRGKLIPILKELEDEGSVELKIEKKLNYYAIAGTGEILKKKREEQRRIQRESINKKIKAEEEKYNKEIETLQKQLSEQEAIFETNKSKIFGAGAKAKKEAKQSIEYYSNQIEKLKQDYLNKKSSLQAELQKL